MQVLNYTDFRKNLKSILDNTIDNDEIVIISRSKDKDVVLISLHEYNSWMETMHLLRSERNRLRLSEAMERSEKNDFANHDLLDE